MPSKLDETSNFLKLYLHAAGLSAIPREYHFWCALSLLAALVADRVWLEKYRGKRLAPNLYVVLVGDSGSGKGVAIDEALSYLPELPHLGYFRGKVTAPRLIDYMGRPHKGADGKRVPPSPKCYLVTPEMSLSLGSGTLADEMVKMLTELYTGGDYTFQHGTRMSGDVLVQGPCVNLIAGSVKEWFLAALTRDSIRGGALARMCLIEPRAMDLKITTPVYPDDYTAVKRHLHARALSLAHMTGAFTMTTGARDMETRWHTSRGRPDNPDLLPSWRRQHTLMLKLAMLLSLAEGGELVVAKRHVAAAIPLVAEAQRPMPEIIALASSQYDMSCYYAVRDLIAKAGRISKSVVLRKTSYRGVTGASLREIVGTLVAEGLVAVKHEKLTDRVAEWYYWRAPTLVTKGEGNGKQE